MRVRINEWVVDRTVRLARSALVAVAIVGVSCTGDNRFTAPQSTQILPAIRITPAQLVLPGVGDSATLQVSGVDAASVSWSVTDKSVATVDNKGTVKGTGVGQTYVKASHGKSSDSAKVVVRSQATELVLSPAADTLRSIGASDALSATFYDKSGRQVVGNSLTFSSSNPSAVSVDGSGTVTAQAPGQATVSATDGTLSASVSVVVQQQVAGVAITPASATVGTGQVVVLKGTALDALGSPVLSAQVSWSTDAPAIATVSNGTVTGQSLGSAGITASASGKAATATVTVAEPVADLVVQPDSVSLTAGSSTQLSAQPVGASGTPLSGRVVAWTSSNPSIATVSGTGSVAAVAAGSTIITATCEGVTAQVSVRVTAAPVASVAITPASASLAIGATIQLGATTRDANGNLLTGRTVTWSSSTPSVATVSGAGLVTAVATGSAAITATSEGQSAQAAITVGAGGQVASITLTPSNDTLPLGGTVQLVATAKDAEGNVLTGQKYSWSSLAPSVAAVSASGLVTALAAGSAAIAATAGGVTGQAYVQVTSQSSSSVKLAVSPASATVAPGQQLSLTVTAVDGSGNTVSTGSYTWSSSNPAIATVDQSGVVTANAAGSATISASTGTSAAAAAITVASGILATHNFDDGTLGPYDYPWTQYPNDLLVVDDPTHSGHGKVVQIHYWRNDAVSSTDRDRGFVCGSCAPQGFGQPLYFSGQVYMATPTSGAQNAMRKLLYWFGSANSDFAVVRANGTSLNVEVMDNSTPTNIGVNIAQMNFDQWYTLEMEVVPNTSPSSFDGIIRIWLNGSLVLDRSDLRLLTAPNETYKPYGVGYQMQYDGSYDEYRYWDDVTFSTQRVGP